MSKYRRPKPLFKREDRVEWIDYTRPGLLQRVVGTVRDVHKLGGYGFAYEVQPDDSRGSIEIAECVLSKLGVLDRMVDETGK